MALDCSRSVMLVNHGSLIPIEGTRKEGSKIRCEDRGKKWYIDGRLVASANPADDVVVVSIVSSQGSPAISAKGPFCVSNLGYQLPGV
jgi:hypothetical protein